MSMISEQVKNLKEVSNMMKTNAYAAEWGGKYEKVKNAFLLAQKTMLDAADTINALSSKLATANSLNSSEHYEQWRYCENGENLPEYSGEYMVALKGKDRATSLYWNSIFKEWVSDDYDEEDDEHETWDVVMWKPFPMI